MKECGKIVLKRLEELIRADRLIVAQKNLDEVSWYSIHSSLQGTFYRLSISALLHERPRIIQKQNNEPSTGNSSY
ncbi:hypothetical protein A3783_15235 [Exiguobacterium undae]|uniref:Uncharacterized protein n=1 Tax=Exiguobacterium undae TaxID=169177 RepID=A0ABX2V5X7_9BACL|nr:hypothetical protein A3783_15235 [Exiguobacterium undae]